MYVGSFLLTDGGYGKANLAQHVKYYADLNELGVNTFAIGAWMNKLFQYKKVLTQSGHSFNSFLGIV